MVNNGKTLKETCEFVNGAFGEEAADYSTVRRWYNDFKSGKREALSDLPRNGRPNSSVNEDNAVKIKDMIEKDRHITIDEMSGVLDISHGSCHTIITKVLKKRYVASKWVPKNLTQEQKEARVDASRQFLDQYERHGEEWLFNILTEDEVWIYNFEPKSKKESMGWFAKDSPTWSKPKFMKTTTKKTLYLIFFDVRGVLVQHPVEPGRTITGAYFAKVWTHDNPIYA